MEWNPDYEAYTPNAYEEESKEFDHNVIHGIEIYEETQEKLNISRIGKIYRIKLWHFIPFLGPLFSLIYLNYTYGKTRCLNFDDADLFRKSKIIANLWSFLIWPLLFIGLIILSIYLITDVSSKGSSGYFVQWWNNWINAWKGLDSQGDTYAQIQYAMDLLFNSSNVLSLSLLSADPGGLLGFIITPITTTIGDPSVGLPINLWVIIAYALWSFLDIHTFIYSSLMNKHNHRFFVVYENLELYNNR